VGITTLLFTPRDTALPTPPTLPQKPPRSHKQASTTPGRDRYGNKGRAVAVVIMAALNSPTVGARESSSFAVERARARERVVGYVDEGSGWRARARFAGTWVPRSPLVP